MASQSPRRSSKDDEKETLDRTRSETPSKLQTNAIPTKADELSPTSLSGPRTRKPPIRLLDEIATRNLNAGSSIEDPEDLTSDKEDQQAGDPDYDDMSAKFMPQVTSDVKERPPVYAHNSPTTWEAKFYLMRRELHAAKTVATDVRKKRTEDRRLGALEKADRIRLEKEVKQLIGDRAQLRDGLRRAQEHFEERLEQQQNDFNKAQAAMTKLLQKDETVAIADDIVRDSLQSLKSEWKSWAKEYSNPAFQDCPEPRIRDLIEKVTPNTSAVQQERIFRTLSRKQSGSVICVNALLAFDVCEKTFGEPFLSMLALKDGHEYKKMCAKFLGSTKPMGGDQRQKSLWRAQTLQLAELHGWDPSKGDLTTHLASRETILEPHYTGLSMKFLSHVAHGMFKELSDADAGKRERELKSIYREAVKLSIRLWKQATHPLPDITKTFQEIFTRSSNNMQPHSSMLLDEDDVSCDGRLVDMVIEPGLFAYGDAHGQHYDMRKTWMKATVLIFDPPLGSPLETAHQAGLSKPISVATQKPLKHQIKVEDHEDEHQTKRTKKTMPLAGFGGKYLAKVQSSTPSAQQKPVLHAPQIKPSNADAKTLSRRMSNVDAPGPNNRNKDHRSPGFGQNSSRGEPSKQDAGNQPSTLTPQTTTVGNRARAPPPGSRSLKATMVGEVNIPQMDLLSRTLDQVANPKVMTGVWAREKANDDATTIMQKAEESTAKNRASMTPASQKKPGGLYHENATSAGSGAPGNPRANLPKNSRKATDPIKLDD